MQKVSIIIPVYNVERYLSRCLDSIIFQTYQNLEIICVNDCSTDGSQLILEQYQKLDSRIKIYQNETHSCAAATRNYGIDISTGDYIMFVDGDDYAASIMVEKMVNYIEKTNAEVLVADYCARNFRTDLSNATYAHKKQLNEPPMRTDVAVPVDKNRLENYLSFAVTCWNKIYSSEFLKSKNIKFPLTQIYEDVVFWADVWLNAERISYTPNAYYYYRKRRKGSLMAKRDEDVYFVIDIHQKMADLFRKYSMYDQMKNILDYIMIRDFCVKLFQLPSPLNNNLFDLIKKSNFNISFDDLYKLNLSEESKKYIDYYKIVTESSFEDFYERTKDHVLIDA